MTPLDISTLETRGYANVQYPSGLRAKVLHAVEAWREFCALPNEIKQKVAYSGDLNLSGVGYELKLVDGATNDLKEDFHVRLTERDFLTSEGLKVGAVATTFIDKAFELNEHIIPVVRTFAEAAESQFGMIDFVADVQKKEPRMLIRFIHYFGDRQPGDEIAMPHVDKGGFTLHLYESHPGLQYLTQDRVWQPMTFTENETAVIPAMRTQYRSGNQLKATCHRVVADHETAKNGRFSVVCFVDFDSTPYYDKARYGRLQDQPLAFNYDLQFEAFKDLFIEK